LAILKQKATNMPNCSQFPTAAEGRPQACLKLFQRIVFYVNPFAPNFPDAELRGQERANGSWPIPTHVQNFALFNTSVTDSGGLMNRPRKPRYIE